MEQLERARTDGIASQRQIEVLEEAAAEGRDVTAGEYREAFNLSVACTEQAGVTVVNTDRYGYHGSVAYSMVVHVPISEDEEAAFAAMAACLEEHSDYLKAAYLSREASQEFVDATIEEYLPAMIECVRQRGYEVDDEATYQEVVALDVAANEDEGVRIGCVQSTGLNDALTSAD